MAEPNKERVLVVEDDLTIARFICYTLENEGYRHCEAGTGAVALELLSAGDVDLMLLDLGLPDMDGKQLISRVREWSEMPIIVVSARDQDQEKAAALDLGADDYLTKPFSTTELLARIKVAIRHLRLFRVGQEQTVLQVGDLSMDLAKRLVYLEGREIHMTPMEYSLLSLLFRNMGKVLTTGFIIQKIYGETYGTDTQALRALMAGLRRKIEANPGKPRYIRTEVGVGYRLVDE